MPNMVWFISATEVLYFWRSRIPQVPSGLLADQSSLVKIEFRIPCPAPAPCLMQILRCFAQSIVSFTSRLDYCWAILLRQLSQRLIAFNRRLCHFRFEFRWMISAFFAHFLYPSFMRENNHTENNSLTYLFRCPSNRIHFLLDRPEEEAGSVLSTAKSYLALYRDPVVANNISDSDFCVRDLMHQNNPVSLYNISPGWSTTTILTSSSRLCRNWFAGTTESRGFFTNS